MTNNEFIKIISYLSFDFTENFFEEMGLTMLNIKEFRQELRKIVIDVFSNKLEMVGKDKLSTFTINRLKANLESEDIAIFQYWLDNINFNTHSDKPDLSAWNIIFNRLMYNTEWAENLFKEYPKGKELKDLFRKKGFGNDVIGEKYKLLAFSMLSIWDTEMFAVNNLCFDYDNDQLLSFIKQSVLGNNLIKLSKEFSLELDIGSINWLNKIGQETILQYGIWMPKKLISFEKLYFL